MRHVFSCQTNGFLHRSSFYRKTEKQKLTFNLQIDISLSLAFFFLLIIQKVNKRKRSVNVRFYRRSRLQSKKAHHRLHCGKYPSAKREICAQYSALKSEFSIARAVKFKRFKKKQATGGKKNLSSSTNNPSLMTLKKIGATKLHLRFS